MAEKKPMMIVVRVSEMPESPVPSTKKKCGRCGKQVWVSDANLALSGGMELVCPPCITADLSTSPN